MRSDLMPEMIKACMISYSYFHTTNIYNQLSQFDGMSDLSEWGEEEEESVKRFKKDIAEGRMGKPFKNIEDGINWLKTLR